MHKLDVITQTWGGALIGGGLVTAGPGIRVCTSPGCPRFRHCPTSWRISVSWSSPGGTPSGASWLVVLGWSSYRAACSSPVASAGTSLRQYLPPAFSSLPPININEMLWYKELLIRGITLTYSHTWIMNYHHFFYFMKLLKIKSDRWFL